MYIGLTTVMIFNSVVVLNTTVRVILRLRAFCGVTPVSTNDIMSETKSTQQYKQSNSFSAVTK